MKKILLFLLVTVPFFSQERLNRLQNNFLIGADLGVTLTSSDYEDLGAGFNLRSFAEYYFLNSDKHNIGLKGLVGFGSAGGKDDAYTYPEFNTSLYFISGGGVYSYKFKKNIYPYAYFGIQFLHFTPEDGDGNSIPQSTSDSYSKNIFTVNFEVGVKFFVSQRLAVTAAATLYPYFNDYIDGRKSGESNDISAGINVGVAYTLTSPWVGKKKTVTDYPKGIDEKEIEEAVDSAETYHLEESIEKEEMVDKTPETIETEKEEIVEDAVTNIDVVESDTDVGIVHFDFGETEISRFEYIELDKLVDIMRENPNSRWKILAYTDNVEPVEVHQSLAIQRAYFVLRYFMSKEIERNRFEIIVKGEEEPVADNSTPEGRALNRRVEVVKVK